ncbi:RNA recognition motif-containing protein, partial [Kappamyces sp. JEL0680]
MSAKQEKSLDAKTRSDADETTPKDKATAEKKPKKVKDGIHSKSTLFVSTLPFEATSKDLEEFFSDIGPIRSCFIVKKKETGESTGCGYVQFALPSDAARALEVLKKKKYNNKRTLKLTFAVRKSVVAERKEAGIALSDQTEKRKKAKKQTALQKKPKTAPEAPATPSQPAARPLDRSITVLIEGLPNGLAKAVLYKKVRKFGEVRELTLDEPQNDTETMKATVVYKLPAEAANAAKRLDKHTYKGVTILCRVVPTVSAAYITRKARLIIRNLSFQCKKDHLLKVFESFGKITDCNVPSTADGKARGFGF